MLSHNKSSMGWTEPTGTLGELVVEARQRAALLQVDGANIRARAVDARPALPFARALRGEFIRVIAEVKRSSPSKGSIAPGLNALEQAGAYERGGAAAVSVLTQPTRFGGSLSDLATVAHACQLPVIRKDFLVDPLQLWEARSAGASAALLIVRALSPDMLPRMVDTALEAGLETLVEIRDLQELERALVANAMVIGVNNRNLETLVIDPSTAPRVIRDIPSDRIAVAESGMRSADDISEVRLAGADAILVGSAVSAAARPEASVRDLSTIYRIARPTGPAAAGSSGAS